MDASGRINKLKDKKGIAIVYVALMLVVLLGFVGLAIDLGYMYVAKGQLQNAADAAALAGASQLPNTYNVTLEAKKFAASNKAAGDNVIITDSDISIGNWDYSRPEDDRFSTTITPYNAVKVVARRVVPGESAANQGMVRVFFGKVFALLPGGGTGWPEMGAAASAIAYRPPRPTIPIALCITPCSMSPPPSVASPVKFYFKQSGATAPPPELTIGWTVFSATSQSTPQKVIEQYISGELHSPNVCNKSIYTNNGVSVSVSRLSDELAIQKQKTGLPYWEVIVPILSPITTDPNTGLPLATPISACPPGDQPIPYPLTQFALAHIISVDTGSSPGVTFSQLTCLPCDDPQLMGLSPVLAK